jgi:hypothetical protein
VGFGFDVFFENDAMRFSRELDRVTLKLLAAQPRSARRWGLARKRLARYGDIIIPDTAKEKPQQAQVIAAGSGKRTEDGKTLPLDAQRLTRRREGND